jgi:RNA recognition motif-containing protein
MALEILDPFVLEGVKYDLRWSIKCELRLGKTLFLKHLDPRLTEEEIIQVVSRYGTIEYCKVSRDQAGQSKRYGSIRYVNIDSTRRRTRTI